MILFCKLELRFKMNKILCAKLGFMWIYPKRITNYKIVKIVRVIKVKINRVKIKMMKIKKKMREEVLLKLYIKK